MGRPRAKALVHFSDGLKQALLRDLDSGVSRSTSSCSLAKLWTRSWATLWRLAFPLTRPALVTVCIYNGLAVWNGFLLPLILTQSPSKRTLPLALWSFQGQYGVNVPAVLASVVLTTLPILVLYAIGRRQLLSGLTAGFSK